MGISETKRPTLNRLTSLRAAAALAVFCYHTQLHGLWRVGGIGNEGYVGVAFFFVLSGFVLGWAAPVHDTAKAFYRRRFARIYPAYFVMLVIALIVPVVAVGRSALAVLASLTLTQAWFAPKLDIVFGANGVSWTLSCEAFFYLLLPFVLPALLLATPKRRVQVAGAWFVAMNLLVVFSAITNDGNLIGYVNPIVRSGEFFIGVVAALAMKDGWRPPFNLLTATLVTVALAAILTLADTNRPAPDAVLALPFLAMLVAAAASDISSDGRGWLEHRWMIYLGQVSFCFYLVHELVIMNFMHWVSLQGVLGTLAALGLSVLAAMALHHAVERPMQTRLRGKQQLAPTGSEAPTSAI